MLASYLAWWVREFSYLSCNPTLHYYRNSLETTTTASSRNEFEPALERVRSFNSLLFEETSCLVRHVARAGGAALLVTPNKANSPLDYLIDCFQWNELLRLITSNLSLWDFSDTWVGGGNEFCQTCTGSMSSVVCRISIRAWLSVIGGMPPCVHLFGGVNFLQRLKFPQEVEVCALRQIKNLRSPI